MEQQKDREARIGLGLVLGLLAFVLIALVSFYLRNPAPELSGSIRDNIASTAR